jgi:hypothetical protein
LGERVEILETVRSKNVYLTIKLISLYRCKSTISGKMEYVPFRAVKLVEKDEILSMVSFEPWRSSEILSQY